ncbi:MAG: 3-deoxy-7-phosphoheptulonate synthase, partial [Candidatus Woesearchaeota archaeon]
ARNMASFGLLKEIGELTAEDKKPIIFKRGFGSTIKEFVAASGYLSDKGNENIIFCLRGIRTFEQSDSSFRFTPDIASVIELKEKSSYPVIFDPSHSGGKRKYVKDLSVAALSIGADGLIVEVHDNPDSALSDKDQQLNFDEFNSLMDELEKIILSNRSFQNQV